MDTFITSWVEGTVAQPGGGPRPSLSNNRIRSTGSQALLRAAAAGPRSRLSAPPPAGPRTALLRRLGAGCASRLQGALGRVEPPVGCVLDAAVRLLEDHLRYPAAGIGHHYPSAAGMAKETGLGLQDVLAVPERDHSFPRQVSMSAFSSASDKTGTSAIPSVLIFMPSMILAPRES